MNFSPQGRASSVLMRAVYGRISWADHRRTNT
jgi:hypothetical protein